MRAIGIALSLTLSLAAQPPAISRTGIFNSASRIPTVFPAGAIARGAKFTIVGVRLGPSPDVRIGRDARIPVVRLSASEIEARMPEDAPLGESIVTVKTADGSASAAIRVVRSGFGIYSVNGVTFEKPARPGGIARLSGTGLGRDLPRVWVGGELAKVVGTRRTPEADEITIKIPRKLPEGCAVPVQAEQAGIISNTITIPVGRSDPCAIASYAPPLERRATRSGAILLVRTARQHPETPAEQIADEALATFVENDGADALRWPPLGTCSTWVSRDEPDSELEWLTSWIGTGGLDAGPRIIVASARSRRSVAIAARTGGLYYRKLGGEGGMGQEPPLLLDGELLLTGTGGRDIGAFRITAPAPQPFTWTEPADMVERSRGLTIRWNGGLAGGAMAIGIYSATAGAVAGCLCVATAETGSFAIPSRYLSNLPPTHDTDSRAGIVIATIPGRNAKPIPASGLSNGWASGVFARLISVQVR